MSTTTITYIGGPTAVLEYAGLRIVTDPTFDPPQSYAIPGSATLVKTAGPGVERAALPPIDLVLLSHHGHKDNLDYEGLELLATGVLTLSTPDAATELFGGGLVGLDDWESHHIGEVAVTAVPALHGPPGSERWVGRVTGFVMEAPGEPTVYVSGDNASLALVSQIAERFPAVDIALLFAGAAQAPNTPGTLTLTSAESVDAARALGVSRVVGLHTEDWRHFTESRADLEAAFAEAGLPLVATPRGERVAL
jgi:L-ascorbate metabolism protein UlaG (beta-lactamase superfamily)